MFINSISVLPSDFMFVSSYKIVSEVSYCIRPIFVVDMLSLFQHVIYRASI